MIRLTTETKINKNGEEVDNSLFLVRVDVNNLALKRGNTIENYFGCVETAIRRSINYVIKGSQEALTLELMLDGIDGINKVAKELRNDCIEIEKKGAQDDTNR